jgi:hypothetical protein
LAGLRHHAAETRAMMRPGAKQPANHMAFCTDARRPQRRGRDRPITIARFSAEACSSSGLLAFWLIYGNKAV